MNIEITKFYCRIGYDIYFFYVVSDTIDNEL